MEKYDLRQKLRNSEMFGKPSIRALLNGTRKPSYEKMLVLYEKHNIPFTAWKDIKAFLSDEIQKKEAKGG